MRCICACLLKTPRFSVDLFRAQGAHPGREAGLDPHLLGAFEDRGNDFGRRDDLAPDLAEALHLRRTLQRLADVVHDLAEVHLRDDHAVERLRETAGRRIEDIEANPGAYDEPDVEKDEALRTWHMLAKLWRDIGAKYPLNVLTDAGVLPNYAFPEPGVMLESVVAYEEKGKRRYESFFFHNVFLLTTLLFSWKYN